MPSFRDIPGIAALLGRLVIGHITTPRPSLTLELRLQSLPLTGAPISAALRVHWNEHLIPYIDADNERDLAVGLGIVHGHLRLGQIEFMRYASQGRLAELLGAVASDMDQLLRVLNLGHSTPKNIAAMSTDTRNWMEGFAAGLNHVVKSIQTDRKKWPEEFQILNVAPQAWSVADLLTVSRLNSADFTWSIWPRLMPLRPRRDWREIWRHLMQYSGGPPIPSNGVAHEFDADNGFHWLSGLFGKPGGSNAVAVDAQRGSGNTAKLSGDPHLPMMLPGFWLMAGLRCPTLNALGYMLPGLPAIMVGRSPHIAWGGTSLHAASSDLFDISTLPETDIETREESIRQRWGKKKTVNLRSTKWGPVLNDAPMFAQGKNGVGETRMAVKWVGHNASDEISALLAAARATSFDAFQSAIEGFGAGAQNMVYADINGNIGQLMAAQLPSRPPQRPDDMLRPMDELRYWKTMVSTRGLPSIYNPSEGFVASANNRPTDSEVLVSCFFSPDDRVSRMRKLLSGDKKIDLVQLSALQRDIHSDTATALRDELLMLSTPSGSEAFRCLEQWNGDYDINSRGALAFEFLLYEFVKALHSKDDMAIYTANWDPRSLLFADLKNLPRTSLAKAFDTALPHVEAALKKYRNWGEVHRLRANHPLAAIPILGKRWRFGEMPIAGANETLMKSAHGFATGKHYVGMSSTARYLFDLGDMDSNWLVMLGGQDGCPGSPAFFDQLEYWQEDRPIQLPLRIETIRESFAYCSEFQP